jgi:hypothetical protein
MDIPDLKILRLSESRVGLVQQDNKPPRHKPGKRFLKGPIPWEWLTQAAKLPGHTLHLATALWFLAGIEKKRTVKITHAILNELGVKRATGYRALEALEKAALVSVERKVGRSPRVTILDKTN